MIDNRIEEKKRQEFQSLLYELAASRTALADVNDRNDYYKRFEELYKPINGEEFHHYYSDIFAVLYNLQIGKNRGSIDDLAFNVSHIKKNYIPQNSDFSIYSNLRKLYDHLSLDVARIRYSDNGDTKISGEDQLSKIKNEVNRLQNDVIETQKKSAENELLNKKINDSLKDINDKNEELQKELDETKKSYIEILGIFSGIVLAFMGGMIFSSSVLENMHQSSIYRIILVSLIIASLTLNALFICFNALYNITKKDKPKIKAWVTTNVIILIVLAGVVIAWHKGFIETRNKDINHSTQTVNSPE